MSMDDWAGVRSKICTRDELLRHRAAARAGGRTLVQCHGCFDIVHPGHIRHLRFAKAQGDLLLVTITGDDEVRKGTGRPLIPQELRAENLAELDCVDMVYIEPRATAADLLNEVAPDIYIKGREYATNNDPRFAAERRAVEARGGRVVFSSGDIVFSSTALISALTAESGEGGLDPFHHRLTQLLDDPELSAPRLGGLVGDVRGRRVLVVGETIIDSYVFCDRPNIAGESPVMTLRPVEHRHYDGGAAVIALHAAAMGAVPTLVTALPRSKQAEAVRRRLTAAGVDVRSVTMNTPLPEKQRFLVHAQKVMKLDLVDPLVLDAAAQDELIDVAQEAAAEAPTDAAIVADFGLGLLGPAVMHRMCDTLRPLVGILSGDVSGRLSGLRDMRRMDLVCPSEDELRDAYRNFGDGLPAVVWAMLNETKTAAAIVTMGPEGLIGFNRLPAPERAPSDGYATRLRGEHVPALSPHAVDALGCGDALLTAATLSLAAGGTLRAASMLGAIAAAVESRRVGNVPVTATDLRREVQRLHASHVAIDAGAAGTVTTRGALATGPTREAS